MFTDKVRILEDLSRLTPDADIRSFCTSVLTVSLILLLLSIAMILLYSRYTYRRWESKVAFTRAKPDKNNYTGEEVLELLAAQRDKQYHWIGCNIQIQNAVLISTFLLLLAVAVTGVCVGFYYGFIYDKEYIQYQYRVQIEGDIPQELMNDWKIDNWNEDGTCIITRLNKEG